MLFLCLICLITHVCLFFILSLVLSYLMFCLFFFFKYTATPDIYTYGHTLSLHDALPICSPSSPPPEQSSEARHPPHRQSRQLQLQPRRIARTARLRGPGAAQHRRRRRGAGPCPGEERADRALARPRPTRGRSEEHTSELQSLMRISYAVFCLKKKK